MKTDMQHTIGKQVIQLRLSNRRDAFNIQNRMSEHYRHDLLPAMEILFDEAATEGETLSIRRIEIDLGILSEQDIIRQQWDEGIIVRFAGQLRKKLKPYSSRVRKSAERQPGVIGIGGQWLFYMRQGYLPWNVLQADEAWRQKVLEALSSDYDVVTELRNLIRTHVNAVTRITEQHTEPFLGKLVEILTAQKQPHLSELLNELEILYRALPKGVARVPGAQKMEIRKTFWKIILEVSATGKATSEEMVRRIEEEYFGGLIRPQDLSKDLLSKLPRLKPLIRKWEHEAKISDIDVSSEIAEEMKVRRNGHDKQADEESEAEEEGIFVQQAGAVLLHPFLSTFFNRLELIEAGAFKNSETQQKALYLIHYLCMGTIVAEEHELVIPKVLCAYPLQKPVKKQMRITREEKDEAEHVLEEVIRQWEKLKNTSPAGLREAFLQRSGKLLTKNDLWRIQVETDTIDVLLDHLPWNLSIIKLPWMKDFIQVEWR